MTNPEDAHTPRDPGPAGEAGGSDEKAGFVRAILARPADHLPRWALADWLEDHGDPHPPCRWCVGDWADCPRCGGRGKDIAGTAVCLRMPGYYAIHFGPLTVDPPRLSWVTHPGLHSPLGHVSDPPDCASYPARFAPCASASQGWYFGRWLCLSCASRDAVRERVGIWDWVKQHVPAAYPVTPGGTPCPPT